MSTPTYPGAALGYRAWVVGDKLLLPLYRQGAWWPQEENISSCDRTSYLMEDQHLAPEAGCNCGFHAHHTLAQAKKEVVDFNSWLWKRGYGDHSSHQLVVGAIAARGKVEVHYHGFRAEEVQIIGLLSDFPEFSAIDQEILEKVANTYQVPLCNAQQLTNLGERLAVSIPEELKPPEPEPVHTPTTLPEVLYITTFAASLGICIGLGIKKLVGNRT